MSVAGRRSSRGDEYQLRVAVHWLIRLLADNDIDYIQAEPVTLPDDNKLVSVDDIVVVHTDGRKKFIQCKKNQPDHENWRLTDRDLKSELRKARDQLDTTDNSEVWFYSRSPFGKLQKLAEDCLDYPDYQSFSAEAPETLQKPLEALANIIEQEQAKAFIIAKHLRFGPLHTFEDWDRLNQQGLDRIVTHAENAFPILERFLGSHQASLRDANPIITRNDVESELRKHGSIRAPKQNESEILKAFSQASQIGRHWIRTVAGKSIPRIERTKLIELIENGCHSVLLMDRPGTGKTCLLLDLADYIEQSTGWGLLFIKGDQFPKTRSAQELADQGMPADIAGMCARLADHRKVVVIIDSLDVLSLNREHGALTLFLGLIDRLQVLDNVTVIVACRSFDLEYDPLLRARQWEQQLSIGELDFKTIVQPLLEEWGLDPSHDT